MTPSIRRCSECKEVKPVEEFRKNSRQPLGYNPYCNACRLAVKIEKLRSSKRYSRRVHRTHRKATKDAFTRRARKLYQQYRSVARKRKHHWGLENEMWFRKEIVKPCFYCGTTANPTNGLDRVNNDLGYLEDNVVPCCTFCNKMKLTHSVEEWLTQIKKIAEHQSEKSLKTQGDSV